MSQVLEFSARTSTDDLLSDVRKTVEVAFNLKFSEGEYDSVPAYVSNLLGMTIGLFEWGMTTFWRPE